MQGSVPADETGEIRTMYARIYSSRALCHYSPVLNPSANTSQALALKHSTLLSKSKQQVNHVTKSKSTATSAPQSPVPSDPNVETSPSLRVGLHMHRPENGIAARVNNVHTFMEMNRHVCCGFVCHAALSNSLLSVPGIGNLLPPHGSERTGSH